MPVTPEKQAIVAELKEKLTHSKGAVLINYRGLTVAQDTKLRRSFREAGVEYKVIKNTFTRIAAKEAGIDGLETYLEGPTAMAYSDTDPVVAARVFSDFLKETKIKVIEVKAGLVEGKVIDASAVKALANLPSREVLLAQVFAGFQAPVAGLVNVLHGTLRNAVCVLEAIRQQKESA